MRAKLKWLSWDDPDTMLSEFVPSDPKNVSLRLVAGIGSEESGATADLFYRHVCTPQWLVDHGLEEEILIGAGMLLVSCYDYEHVHAFIETYVNRCEDSDWEKLALRISRVGRWEYYDDRSVDMTLPEFLDWARNTGKRG